MKLDKLLNDIMEQTEQNPLKEKNLEGELGPNKKVIWANGQETDYKNVKDALSVLGIEKGSQENIRQKINDKMKEMQTKFDMTVKDITIKQAKSSGAFMMALNPEEGHGESVFYKIVPIKTGNVATTGSAWSIKEVPKEQLQK